MIPALYVDPNGVYGGLQGVDPWDADRDGRTYAGPGPVIAHPPCGHWGKFWWRCKQPPSYKDCGPIAVAQVRAFGGVLEHPKGSRLWPALDLPRPGDPPDSHRGWTLEVNQVDWGHVALKPTWLYIVGTDTTPPVPESREPTHCMVRKRTNAHPLPECPKRLRHLTPRPFAVWLRDLVNLSRLEAAHAQGARDSDA